MKMIFKKNLFFLVFATIMYFCSVSDAAKRLKRELRFPKGSSFFAAVALTSLLPKGLTDGFVHVLEFDLGFPFPEKFAINKVEEKKKIVYKPIVKYNVFDNHLKKKYRIKRNLKEIQRQNFISTVENAITRVGYDGRACIKRFQCELQQTTPGNSLLEEIILAIFKMSFEYSQEVCEEANRNCTFSLLHVLSHSQQIEF